MILVHSLEFKECLVNVPNVVNSEKNDKIHKKN